MGFDPFPFPKNTFRIWKLYKSHLLTLCFWPNEICNLNYFETKRSLVLEICQIISKILLVLILFHLHRSYIYHKLVFNYWGSHTFISFSFQHIFEVLSYFWLSQKDRKINSCVIPLMVILIKGGMMLHASVFSMLSFPVVLRWKEMLKLSTNQDQIE